MKQENVLRHAVAIFLMLKQLKELNPGMLELQIS